MILIVRETSMKWEQKKKNVTSKRDLRIFVEYQKSLYVHMWCIADWTFDSFLVKLLKIM